MNRQAAVVAFTSLIIGYALILFLFFPAPTDIDELGLFNPVYMWNHHGRMTYPVHYQPDNLTVHPPLRYLEVGVLMRAGLSLPYAERMAVVLLIVTCALVVALATFDIPTKLGLLLGFFSAVLFISRVADTTYGLRPDTELALGWWTGLLLLEDARLRMWQASRLFFGSLLVTYASGLHYYGAAGVAALGIYFCWAIYKLRRRAERPCAAIAAGFIVLAMPYTVLFLLPDFEAIKLSISQVQAGGSWLAPIQRHVDQYKWWSANARDAAALYWAALPVAAAAVPGFAVGSGLLAAFSGARGLATASLPLCLLVFAYSKGKSAGYFLPELIVYFSGLATILFLGVRRLSHLAGPRAPLICRTASALFVAVVLWKDKAFQTLEFRIPPAPKMEIMRAAAREVVGPDALIGGRVGLWYISGATHWYNIESDLLWRRDIPFDLRRYFERFDAIAEHSHMSNVTVNSRLESVASWYASGVLKLRAFFLSDAHPHLSFLLLSPKKPPAVRGFLLQNGRLFAFDALENGSRFFLTLTCALETRSPHGFFSLSPRTVLYLPKGSRQDPGRSYFLEASPGNPQQAIVVGMAGSDGPFSAPEEQFPGCRCIDRVRGAVQPLDWRSLVGRLRATDGAMHFYTSLDDAVVARLGRDRLARLPLEIGRFQALNNALVRNEQRHLTVTTPRQPWSFAAQMPVPSAAGGHGAAWIQIRGLVRRGAVGLGILDDKRTDFVSRRFVHAGRPFDSLCLALDGLQGSGSLIVENGATDYTPSEVELHEIVLLEAKPQELHGN